MRGGSVFAGLLGLGRAVVEGVGADEGALVVRGRLRRRDVSRCGVCGRRSPGYDRGVGRRRWRALDLGSTKAFVEAAAPRVRCRVHGVVVARVAWARHGSWFTREFEDQVAWLATQCSKSAVCALMRISWLTVGRIIERVLAEQAARRGDSLAGLRRIGIDELSYRKGQRSITLVVDHDSGRLVWAQDGRDRKTVARFFDQLGLERCQQLELVSSDMGDWITHVVAERCPGATLCLDPFHVVALAGEALDTVRREVWRDAHRGGDRRGARWVRGARWALWKRPERLTDQQRAKLHTIEHTKPPPLPRLPAQRNSCAWSSMSPTRKRRPRCLMPGLCGRAAAASPASSSSPRRSASTTPAPSRPSHTGSRTLASRPPTQRSG